jgi:hypothetical protein
MARTLRANDNGRPVENIAERRAALAQKKRPKMEIYWPGRGLIVVATMAMIHFYCGGVI